MASIDKAAIVFSIAIALVGVGIAVAGSAAYNAPVDTAPAVTIEIPEPTTPTESFGADISEKVRAGDDMMDESNMEESMMEETMMDEESMMEETMMDEESMMEETMMDEESMMEETMMDEESMMEETMMDEESMMEETMMDETAGPTTHTVDIPKGTSVAGCEESNACYLPADITINAGDTVEWINVDTAAHTVSSGSPAGGLSGVFDSSLVMANANFDFTFDDAGSYDYFCLVHPWMVGSVTVN